MLQLAGRHLSAFAEYMQVSFRNRLFAHVQQNYPELFGEETADSFATFLAQATERGRRFQFVSEWEIAEWTVLCRQYPVLLTRCPDWALEILLYPNRPSERRFSLLRAAFASQ